MKARKILAALGAALMMFAICAPASAFDCADKDTMADALKTMAKQLRCEGISDKPAMWNPDNPLWEKRRMPSCAEHESAAAALYDIRASKGKNPKPTRERGVAVALAQGNFEEALRDLEGFRLDVSNNDPNRAYDPSVLQAQLETMKLITESEEASACIVLLIP